MWGAKVTKNKVLTVFLWMFWCLPLAGADQTKVAVVASNSIIEDLVREVSGQNVDLSVLVSANNDPHSFEPQPKDNIAIAKADIIFENGLYLEPWMNKLYQSAQSKARRIVLSQGIDLIESSSEHDDHENHEDEYDPHVWHDVSNVRVMVQAICKTLVEIDPLNATEYQANALNYDQELQKLDQWIWEQTAHISKERKKLVTSHDTFGYFARRYGFDVVGTVIDSATTEASDPSAMKLAGLIKKIQSAGVSAIFVENVSNPQLVKTVANEAGVKVAPSLYTDALGEKNSLAGTYIQMMRTNVKIIVEALRQ